MGPGHPAGLHHLQRLTSGARQYAENVPSRIILIDSARLMSIMIRYRVGVQVKQSCDVVELDEDFFE
jgi:restriction system protein